MTFGEAIWLAVQVLWSPLALFFALILAAIVLGGHAVAAFCYRDIIPGVAFGAGAVGSFVLMIAIGIYAVAALESPLTWALRG